MEQMCQFESMSLNQKENPVEENTPVQFENETINMHEASSHLHEDTHEDSAKDKGEKKYLQQFLVDIEQLTDPESKLQKAIDFMETSLSQGGVPHFKSFWEARNLCLELFKQNISPALRSTLWAKYSELSKEARRLKDILEEQSAFAAEQIEIAIQALETEMNHGDAQHASMPDFVLPACKALEHKIALYNSTQRELNFLNVLASRINALRKELIKTEMRIRTKNKFFQRLSLIGDKVFPKRKDLIKQISQNFIEDVEHFIRDNFQQDRMSDSLFTLREEIKALQGIAKLITLNTQSFTQTRLNLSSCWDKVKVEEKERKKERSAQKTVFKQNYDKVHEQIEAFNQAFTSHQLTTSDATSRIDEIISLMRSTELGKEELKALRDSLGQSRKLLQDKIKQDEQTRISLEEEKVRQKRQQFEDLSNEISDLIDQSSKADVDTISDKRTQMVEKISSSPFSKIEKMELEKKLKPLRDIIAEKKQQSLLALSEDDRMKLQKLKDLLQEKKERRQEIKKQLETYRKASKGSSGMDISQALQFNTQIEEERERLDKITLSIEEIEETIDSLEQKL